jgi:iron complex outermembrane receptor protein
MRVYFSRVVAVILTTSFALIWPLTSTAQVTDVGRGELFVTVADSTGARVAGAFVLLTRGAERRTSTTATDGTARFSGLSPGEWTVTVTSEGFSRWVQTVNVPSGSLDVPVGLDIAGLAETVQVEGAGGPPTQIPLNAPASGGTNLDIPVRDLPASLFLVGQSLIQERGARSVEEAVQLAVGMQASTGVGSIPSYSTRGWGSNNVSIMRDGVRQNTNSQSSRPLDAFLLDRIEILKGPSSLLYGEGAIGGAVNLVSKSPVSEPTLDTLLAYGSYGQYRAGLGLNGALGRKVFARFDVSQSGSDGYVEDSPQKLAAAFGAIRWLPTSNVSIKGSATYTYDDTSAYYATPFINGEFDRRTRDINYNMEDRLTKSHNKWGQVEADALLGGGWQFHNQFFVATHDLDWRNYEGYSYNANTNKVEVRSYFLIWRDDLLVGDRGYVRKTFDIAGRPMKLIVGGEAQRNDLERAGNPSPDFPVPVVQLDPFNPAPHFDPGFSYVPQRDVLIKTQAVFAENIFEIVPRFKIISGLRWEHIDLAYTPYPTLETASQRYEPTTGRLGAVFDISTDVNVYASYSRAVEPTTQLVSLTGSQQRFSLVPGRQLEIGSKGAAFGGRLEGTFAYFNIEKRDILITQLIDGIQTAQQIGKQSSYGYELAGVVRLTDTLRIAADVAHTWSEFDEFIQIVNNVNTDMSGNTPPNVPEVIWNISPYQQVGPVDVSATFRYVGTRWGDNANTRLVDGYGTVDVAAGYRLGRGMRLTVRGRNLTDNMYTQSISNTAGRLEPPRSIDVTFAMNVRRF